MPSLPDQSWGFQGAAAQSLMLQFSPQTRCPRLHVPAILWHVLLSFRRAVFKQFLCGFVPGTNLTHLVTVKAASDVPPVD